MKQLLEIACFDKHHAYKGGVEIVGNAPSIEEVAMKIIDEITSDENSGVAYCTQNTRNYKGESYEGV